MIPHHLPKISVLTTVYNGEDTVSDAIESVLTQRAPRWEMVIVDDGSTDLTFEVAQFYGSMDERIRPVSVGRIGRGAALNEGVSICRGEYIAILDADDLALSGRLDVQSRYLDENADVALVGGWAKIADMDGGVRDVQKPPNNDAEIRRKLVEGYPFTHSTVTYRKSTLESLNGFAEELESCIDYDVAVRLAQVGRMGSVDEVVGIRRLGAGRFFKTVDRVPYLLTATSLRIRAIGVQEPIRWSDWARAILAVVKNAVKSVVGA